MRRDDLAFCLLLSVASVTVFWAAFLTLSIVTVR